MAEKTPQEILKKMLTLPKSISADGESVSQHQLSEVLEALKALPATGKKPGARLCVYKPTGNSAV